MSIRATYAVPEMVPQNLFFKSHQMARLFPDFIIRTLMGTGLYMNYFLMVILALELLG